MLDSFKKIKDSFVIMAGDFSESLQNKRGTYAGIKYDATTENKLKEFIEKNQIPNGNGNDLHTTLLYSTRFLPLYEPKVDVDYGEITFKRFRKFDNILVLELNAPGIVKRHNELMLEHDAVYDYEDYIPHITISYSADEIDDSKLDGTFFTYNNFKFKAIEEYSEDLDLNWQPQNI